MIVHASCLGKIGKPRDSKKGKIGKDRHAKAEKAGDSSKRELYENKRKYRDPKKGKGGSEIK